MNKNQWSKKVLIKPRFLKGYEWMDRSDSLIHYMFEHLCLFVEKEMHQICWYDTKKEVKDAMDQVKTCCKLTQKRTAAYVKEHQRVKKEIDFLYVWWTEARPSYIDATPFMDIFYKKYPKYCSMEYWSVVDDSGKVIPHKKQDAVYAEHSAALAKERFIEDWATSVDAEMMKRLIDIREYLWS